jgi:hypothetical protein
LYELKIDTNDDAVADIAYRERFWSSKDGSSGADLPRVGVLRSLADGRELISRAQKASRAFVVAAGFIGLVT